MSGSSRTGLMVMLVIVLLFTSLTAVFGACTGQATYEVTFQTLWTASSHPKDYPSTAHWSGLVGGSHNSNYQMWVAGGQSTPGMKSMAEFGGKSTLNNEMRAQGSNVLDTLSFTVISAGTGTRKGSLDVDGSHSLVSLVSMVAPSPDWFVGVHDLDLCNGTTWTQTMTVDLFPYDAGTDSGLKFTSADSATNPQEPIYRLTGTDPNNTQSSFYGYDPVSRMATLGFVLRSPTPTQQVVPVNTSTASIPSNTPSSSPTPRTRCPGTQTYNVKFTTLWTAQTYPKDYPGDAHWSGLVGGSHNSRYVMWMPGSKATRGIEVMAETGNQSPLLSEMRAQGSNILETVALNGIGSGTGNRSTNLGLNGDHSQVSLVSMIAPSPDWFVGIHSVDMCNTATFEWRDGDTIDLFPYDAGTDDGLKFDSSNDDTNPKGDITRLTGSMPNNAQSSFYGYQQLQPIAQMKLTKGAGVESGSSRVMAGIMTITSACLLLFVLV